MILEICANSFQSAKNAQDVGAHRIELCSELQVGGITPSFGLIKHVLSNIQIPVFILIRPRSGDFVYSKEEFNHMMDDIALCKDLGAKGIVSGVLTKHGEIDRTRNQELIHQARPLEFTFNRAFDEVNDPLMALEQLKEIGADRILTSGQAAKAECGLGLLKTLVSKANGCISIMAGSGINAQNVSKIKAIGIGEIHASASSKINQQSGLFSNMQTVSDPKKIKSLLDAL